MKKRILSLIMAICMVVLAVPAFVLPATAIEREGFTTTLSSTEASTWPTYESGVGVKKWNGNWAMGYFDGGVYYRHDSYDKQSNVIKTGDAWANTGVFAQTGQVILTEGPAIVGFDGLGEDANAFYAPNTFRGNPVPEDKINDVAAVMAYSAPYTGTVVLDMKSIYGVDRQLTNIKGVTKTKDVYFAIFVNGEMVWPNKGDYYKDPSKWELLSTTEQFKEKIADAPIEVEVSTRDLIQFAVALAPAATSFAMMEPIVTYKDGYSVVPEQVKQAFTPSDRDWPELSVLVGENQILDQTSALWTMGSFNKATGEFTPFASYAKLNNGSSFAYNNIPGSTDKPWIKNGGILLDFPNKALVGAMSTSKDADIRSAYVVESVANGKATVTLSGLALYNATGDVVKNATVNLEIYVNGALKATAPIETNAQGAVKNTVAPVVSVTRGDRIAIVADDFGSVAYVGGTPAITYSDIVSFMNGTPESATAIALEKTNVEVNGSINLLLNAFATRDVYENATDVTLYIWDSNAATKTPATAIVTLPMTMNTDMFSFEAVYSDFAIKNMADSLCMQVVAKSGDTKICESGVTALNIADVAYADYEAATGKLKTMYANLLNYGAYAQLYFNHNTANLANKNLPEDLKALDQEMLYDAQFEATKPSGANTRVCDSEIGSFTLILENTLSIRAYIDRYKTEMGDQHKFYFQYGKTLAGCLNSEKEDFPADGNLSYIIDGIGAHEMSDLHYIRCIVTYPMQIGTSYRDMAYFGYTMTYSVESYASRMLESTELGLADLVRAMMEFGKSAAAVY